MAISVADNFSYKGGKPLDARIKYNTVADMKAVSESDLYDGCLAYVTATKKNYQYDSTNSVDPTTGKWRELQTGGGGGGSYTAGDGIVIDNDEISTDNATSEDIEEILTPLPSVMSRRFKYSTEEQIVGEWIDGKPVYQKTIDLNGQTLSNSFNSIDMSYSGIDTFICGGCFGVEEKSSNYPSQCFTVAGIGYDGSTGKIAVAMNSASRNFKYLTLQYTKTAD